MNDKRNWKIYYDWVEGVDSGVEYQQLADKYELSKDTIKQICTEKVPNKIKQTYWQTANSYRKWRQFIKKQRQAEFDLKQGT